MTVSSQTATLREVFPLPMRRVVAGAILDAVTLVTALAATDVLTAAGAVELALDAVLDPVSGVELLVLVAIAVLALLVPHAARSGSATAARPVSFSQARRDRVAMRYLLLRGRAAVSRSADCP
jgi:hypothetical protein